VCKGNFVHATLPSAWSPVVNDERLDGGDEGSHLRNCAKCMHKDSQHLMSDDLTTIQGTVMSEV